MSEDRIHITPREERTGDVWEILNSVIDPELDIGIVDLGLVYKVDITGDAVDVYMTFTSMGCPAGPEIKKNVEETVALLDEVSTVRVHIVWDPIWGPDLVDPDLRSVMGL